MLFEYVSLFDLMSLDRNLLLNQSYTTFQHIIVLEISLTDFDRQESSLMVLMVAIEDHFLRGPDGFVYTKGTFGYDFWKRYLEVFEQVKVLARVRSCNPLPGEIKRANGSGVLFHDLPDYTGPWEYLRCFLRVRAGVWKTVRDCDAYILRVPGNICTLAWKKIRRLKRPYAVEVVADPNELTCFPGIVPKIARIFWVYDLRKQCLQASAASYVTRDALQRKYPCHNGWTTYFSDVILPDSAFAVPSNKRDLKTQLNLGSPIRLIFIGSLLHYKAPDVLIAALSQCIKRGYLFNLTLVGDGPMRPIVESKCKELGIENHVQFLGILPSGKAVIKQLDKADIFVMPSHSEGLPRAMIEAMARGLPCIGTRVGGIPELLPPEDTIPRNNVKALADKIIEVSLNPQRMKQMSIHNHKVAKDYREEILKEKRKAFYTKVCELSSL